MYYLIGIWGSKDRVRANTTFFIYTVFGSMLMLAGIIFIGFYLKPESFLLEHVMQVLSHMVIYIYWRFCS